MSGKKFIVDGRELETYQMNNRQLMDVYQFSDLSCDERKEITDLIIDRFNYQCCPKNDEDNDDVFARQFGDFVNGRCHDKQKVATLMSRDHRYLQSEMFKVCMEYIKILAENYSKGFYDGRNEYSCTTSAKMINALKTEDWPY